MKNIKSLLELWISERPVEVRKVIERLPPNKCCRSTAEGVRGHYRLYSYDESEDGITVKILHLYDSFLPGVLVFGVSPNDLEVCGCQNARRGR